MISQSRDMDMCNGPLFSKILIFALPIMAMNILQLLFNAADMVIVGQFTGREALAAVGATGSLINLIVNLFMGLSVGTSVVVAQDYGAGQPGAVSRSVHTSIAVSIISGLVVMILGLILCEPLLEMMGTPGDIIDLSVLYMKIYFIGIPAAMVYNFGAAILRAVGDSRRPMYYLIVSGIVNVIFNLFFVIVLRMGVAGVAWATVISQYLSLLLIMICLYRSDGSIRFMPRQMRIDAKKLKDIVKIGLPAGLQGLLFSISNVLIQSAVNSFGSTMVAASSAASNVEGFVGTTMNAYYNAAITFTGQNMGAKKYDRIDTVAKVCTALIFITWIILGGATVIFGKPLLGFYTSDPEVIELGMLRMKVMMVVYFTCGVMNVYPGLTRGMGFSVMPMLCTLVGACLMRIVWLATFFAWYPTVIMLFACYPVTWSLAGLGQVGCFFYARHRIRKSAEQEAELVDVESSLQM
ncbi:MATE family efflux transporter [Clostridium thermosuccinogenes]|uniref:Probable multidrug resistance protein NorM n=1 Tax=Clostridium thermosuccinogenes TaxID=84032 RepID=A0A2K2FS71_9CLOT|nr:MATE family efflux transporter [Pseudoclostridium thermosuccinogenes]AUS97988.1 MATE family efflux transporter [Pseudoclostridium thermosuccinogenes]PNU00286.1 MATE family efflux transporter [Pseudoclostridium thermosuccinogenes]PNU01610.1 MATE family efflux transporter [Pseudoclostridium thermosuccinogenes]